MQETQMSDFDSYIEALNAELAEKKAEIEEVKKKISDLLPAKIYTRKELQEMEKEKLKREEEKKEYEKHHIDLITYQSFQEAENIRKNASDLSPEEKKSAEVSAINIEINALKKSVNIKKKIVEEKENQMNSILADNLFCESKIKKVKNSMNAQNSSQSKIKIEVLKHLFKNNQEEYFRIFKLSEDLKNSVIKLQNDIFNLRNKLNAYR